MSDCLFCKIIAGEIPSTKVYEDEFVYAFLDIDPQAPFHAIFVPKTHIGSATEINDENSVYIAKIYEEIKGRPRYIIADTCGGSKCETFGRFVERQRNED